jgi:hypothetical protein
MKQRHERQGSTFLKIIVTAFLSMIWLSVLLPNAQAAPSVAGFQGTVSNGQSITIDGSGFGASGPNVVIFDDFEGGTNGSPIMVGEGSAQVGGWSKIEGEKVPRYSNAAKVSGNLSFRADMSSYWRELVEVLLPSSTKQVFLSWWIYLPPGSKIPGTGVSGDVNWKNVWLQGAGTEDDDLVLPTVLPGPSYFINGNNGVYQKWITLDFNIGTWKRLWCWISVDAGQLQFWELTGSGVVQRDNANGATILKSGGVFERVDINGYGRATSNSYPTFDDVYVATGASARARVEIGNKSTYSTCTKLTIATPTSWSNTRVESIVWQGAFTSGEAAYLYVIDANGAVNTQGYPVTIGGGGGGDVAPSPPSGLKVVS